MEGPVLWKPHLCPEATREEILCPGDYIIRLSLNTSERISLVNWVVKIPSSFRIVCAEPYTGPQLTKRHRLSHPGAPRMLLFSLEIRISPCFSVWSILMCRTLILSLSFLWNTCCRPWPRRKTCNRGSLPLRSTVSGHSMKPLACTTSRINLKTRSQRNALCIIVGCIELHSSFVNYKWS